MKVWRNFYCLIFPVSQLMMSASFADDGQDRLFDMTLAELLNVEVTVASNIVKDNRKQPVAVTVIDQDSIRLSAARTLNELLSIFVPGYFLVEDQDDTIAGFRGLVPDNNSKTLLLLNGVNLNTEWFWGMPDVIINGSDLQLIERIEVIRGPGSVTLGQGALLGVINIITRSATSSSAQLNWQRGKDDFDHFSFDVSYKNDLTAIYAYFAKGDYHGQAIANRGWAAERSDQGLTVFQRQHRLKRNDFTRFFGKLAHQNLSLDVFHFEQQRDLYSFFRDREVVKQTLNGVAGELEFSLANNINFTLSAHYRQDDYALMSHGHNLNVASRRNYEQNISGFASLNSQMPGLIDDRVEPGLTMGGTRETSRGVKLLVNWDNLWLGNRLAFGLEFVDYHYGLTNDNGDNFVINEEIQRLGLVSDGQGGFTVVGDLNEHNTWVKPDTTQIRSLFIEDFYHVNDKLTLFGAFRYDHHPNWGAHFSPRLGGFYDINDQHLLRLTWQTGFRGAVGVQFSGGFVQDGLLAQTNFNALNAIATTQADFDFDGIAANDQRQLTAIQPETIDSIELAYSFQTDNLHLSSLLFYNRVDDILIAQANGYQNLLFGDSVGSDSVGTWHGNWYYQNQQGELRQFGIELEAEYKLPHTLIKASHAHVSVNSADSFGSYALINKKHAAYPEDVSRLHLRYQRELGSGLWALHYNQLYFWRYYAPTSDKMSGASLANIGVSWTPNDNAWHSLSIDFVVKNLWNNKSLYPINVTGNLSGAEGMPAIEQRTWWLAVGFQF